MIYFNSSFIVLILIVLNVVVYALIDCDDVLASYNKFSGQCNNKWKNLKSSILPTQNQVGYAWIQYKLDKSFSSSKDAQTEMDASVLPGVIGPSGKIYIVDDHHTLCALDYSGYDDTTVTINIICDKRGSTTEEFWSEMMKKNLVFLLSHPDNEPNKQYVAINYTQLPQSFSFTNKDISVSDDPWRSIAGYSRKVTTAAAPAPECSSSSDKYCERCFYRGCVDGTRTSGPGLPYYEFRWSYFMVQATFYSSNLWPSNSQYNDFYVSYTQLPSSKIGNIDTTKWANVAAKSIALCRGASAGAYVLPNYFSSSHLPGYVSGYVPLAEDPTCSSPTC